MDMGTLLDGVQPLIIWAWIPALTGSAALLVLLLTALFHSPALTPLSGAAAALRAHHPATTLAAVITAALSAAALAWCFTTWLTSPEAAYRAAFTEHYGFEPAVTVTELRLAGGAPVFAEDDGVPVMYRVADGRLEVFTEDGPVRP